MVSFKLYSVTQKVSVVILDSNEEVVAKVICFWALKKKAKKLEASTAATTADLNQENKRRKKEKE